MTNEQLTMKNAVSLPPGVCPPVSQDEKERAVFRSRKMFQTDMASDLATAEDRGEKRGRAEGRAEEKLAIARNMMKRNRPIEDIIEDTGLTREEVENLTVNIHH